MPLPRPGLIALVSCTFLAVSAVIRAMLCLMVPSGAGLTFFMVLKATATGLFFDSATLGYALLPLALYLILVPRRFATHRWHPWLVRLCFILFLAVLIFDGCAEYIFFDEFSTRFNFIAVDYLVYTHEVIGNVCESYPLAPIFSAIAAAALGIGWVLRKPLDTAGKNTFHGSFRRSGALLMLPAVIAYSSVHVSQSNISGNNFANELAGNGVYNLFAAFINNELSFTQFYRTAPNEQVLGRLTRPW